MFTFCFAQKQNDNSDSLKVTHINQGFFNWYISSIKENKYYDFKPVFVETTDSMTTLEFSFYKKNLKKYNFSDSLIDKEIKSYSVCIKNLSKVKYSDFGKSSFIDLDEFEQSNCDFGNYYRWIGGQEICDSTEVENIEFFDENKCIVLIKKFDYSDEDIYYWPYYVKVYLKKINGNWKINNINWK